MGTVRRLPDVAAITQGGSTLQDPTYTDAFEVTPAGGDTRSPEQWARSVFEGARWTVRESLLFGWRAVLGLRVGPRPSADHVLGWRIADRGSEWITLELSSSFLSAQLVFSVRDSVVAQSTLVRYDRRIGAMIWPPVSIFHRRIVPYLLGRASSQR